MTRRIFLTEYIKNFREVGAVAPSSKYLAKKMCDAVDFKSAKLIIEYGPGTGIFTHEIKKRMNPDAVLLLIESNSAFHDRLKDQLHDVDGVIVEHDSAENVAKLLKKHKLGAPDAVMSGLPFAALPGKVSQSILRTTADLLGANGVFVTFQYTLLKKNLLGTYFHTIDTVRELRNIPPAYILCCSNKH